MKDFKKLNQEEKVLFRVVKSLFHDLWTHEINPEEAMEEIAKFILPIERLEQLTNTAHYSKPYVPPTLQEQLENYLKEQKEYEESGKQEADRIQWQKEREERERIELKQMKIEEEIRDKVRKKIEKRKKEQQRIERIEKEEKAINEVKRIAEIIQNKKEPDNLLIFEKPFTKPKPSDSDNLLRYILYTNLKDHSPFSKRITNVLISHKIMDISDLITFKQEELIKLRFVSASVIYQIKNYLKEISKDLIIPLTLGMDVKVLASQVEIVNKSLDEK